MSFIKILIKFWIVVLLIAGAVYFSLNNQEVMIVHLTPYHVLPPLPAYMVYLMMFLVGAAVASIFFAFLTFQKNLLIHRLNRQIKSIGRTIGDSVNNSEAKD